MIYFVQIAIIWILSLLPRKSISKRSYCRCVFICLAALMCFRDKSVGLYDTEYIYLPWIQQFKYKEFSDILQNYPLYRGTLLQILTKIFTNFSVSEELWIFLTSIPFCYSIYKLVEDETSSKQEAALCFIILLALRLYSTEFFIIRHGLASACLVMSYINMKKNNIVKYIVWIIIGAMFHSTAIIFLIAYPISKIKYNWKTFTLSIISVLIFVFLLKNNLDMLFSYLDGSFIYYRNYQTEGGANYTFSLICTCLYVATYVLNTIKGKVLPQHVQLSFNMLGTATILMYGSVFISSFYRISYYFLQFGILSLVYAIRLQRIEYRFLICIVILGLLFVTYYLNLLDTNMIPYKTWLF